VFIVADRGRDRHRLVLAVLPVPASGIFHPEGVSLSGRGSRIVAVPDCARRLTALPPHALRQVPWNKTSLPPYALLPAVNGGASARKDFT